MMTEATLERADWLYVFLQTGEWWHASEGRREVTARMIGNLVYDMKPLWSGYVSKEGAKAVINESKKISQLTNEHFYSRQQAGRDIVRRFMNSQSNDREYFYELLLQYCQVHKVLSVENTALVPYQKENLPWEEAYNLAGIELLYVDMSDRKMLTKKHLIEQIGEHL